MESQSINLQEIGRKYNTEKADHGFLAFYEKWFKEKRSNRPSKTII